MTIRIALAIAAVTLVTACSGSPDTPAPSSGSSAMVAVTVGGAGADTVSYTDPASPGGVATARIDSVYAVQVNVPRGTTVNVTLSGIAGFVTPKCWISDVTDKLVYVTSTSTCTYVAN